MPQPAKSMMPGDPAVVPLVDEVETGRVVYHSSMTLLALLGGFAGALVFGFVAWLIAFGVWALRDVGQFGAGGVGVATFTGAGIGLALGALLGGLTALFRIPARHPPYR